MTITLRQRKKLIYIMKWSLSQLFLIIYFSTLGFASSSSAQDILKKKVALNADNEEIAIIMQSIEKQVEIGFTFRDNILNLRQRISIKSNNEILENVLKKMFTPMNISFKALKNQIILYKASSSTYIPREIEKIDVKPMLVISTDITVTGSVKDELGEPMPGVSVMVKGQEIIGTLTNDKGEYSLTVDKDAILVFSFLGYTSREVNVSNILVHNVSLYPDNKILDEVVVVGYATQKKSNLTGAVSTVDGKLLSDRPVSSTALALQGITPGMTVTRISGQPGDDNININIRGASSTSNVNPLLVVDGVIMPLVNLQTMNPNDIENISVLKDASSTSIYGVEGAGGVIVVTTKKGDEGKVKFQYSGLSGIDYALSVPTKLSLLEEANFSNLARSNSGQTPEFSVTDLENIKNGVPYIVDPSNPNAYRYYNNSPLTDQLLDNYMRMTSHSLSASGGSKNVNYLISGAYYHKDGVLKYGGDNVARYNLRSNLGINLSKKVSLDTRISLSNELAKAVPLYSSAGQIPNSGSGTNGQGVIWEIYRNRIQNPIFNPDGKINANANNAFAVMIDGGYNNTQRRILDAVTTLKINSVVKGLSFRSIFGITNRDIERNVFRKSVQRWLINTTGSPFPAVNSMDRAFEDQVQTNLQFLADYDLTLGKNKIHILAGSQYDNLEADRVHTWASNLLSNDLPTLNLADETTKSNAHFFDSRANISGLYRVNYSHDDKYLFESTGRYDGSSRLSPSNRFKFFPSFSAGWNLHKEKFWSSVPKFINEFKIRASYGTNGGASNIGSYNYLNLLERGTNVSFNGVRAAYLAQYGLPSDDISWESIKSTNLGFNVGFLKNKLQVDFDNFRRTTDNLLVPLTLPGFAGILGPSQNDGKLKSWGWEAEIRYKSKAGQHFNYSWSINLSDNNNQVERYLGRNIIKPGNNGVVEGLPLNSIWGLTTNGFFQTAEEAANVPKSDPRQTAGDVRYIDLNNDGKLTIGDGTALNSGDFVNLGNSNPRYTFGTTFIASYKSIDINLFIQGVAKREIMANIRNHMAFPVAFQYPLGIHYDYWTPENPNALFPRPFIGSFFNYWEQDRMILNAAYARLKNVQIGFTLPQRYAKKAKLDKARLFLSGQDLYVLSGLGKFSQMYDPETRTDANAAVNYPNVNGANLFGNTDYPFFSTISLGLNLNF
jgi:TonB-linked SusC/RagA family outer membrane protein